MVVIPDSEGALKGIAKWTDNGNHRRALYDWQARDVKVQPFWILREIVQTIGARAFEITYNVSVSKFL